MTEIPEHLLARSRERRAALGLGGDDTAAATPATTASAAPAPAADAAPAPAPAAAPPAPPKPPKPDLPWVAAAKRRRKVPAFAQVMLAGLPLWALIFAFTNDVPTSDELTPLAEGAAVYGTNCASCHGGGGAGGSGPALADGTVLATFPDPAEQVRWVYLGSDGWKAEEGNTYGAVNKTVAGGMPAWQSLSGEELLTVILHERTTLSGEEFDLEAWQPILEDPLLADKQAELQEVLDGWEAEPPVE
ncbi:MAG: c-type cytochrome [Microthrixaceae bacterium]